jgi:hypothetical protein
MSFLKVSTACFDPGLDMTTVPANCFQRYDFYDGLGMGIHAGLIFGGLHWGHGSISMTLGA